MVAAEFVVLLVTWFALSWRFDPLFIAMGVGAAAFVTALTYPMLVTIVAPSPDDRGGGAPRRVWSFVLYVGWLLGRMVVGSLQVAYFVLHPRMPIAPRLVRFRTTLRKPMARTFVANTITLIPGTLTVDLDGDEYTIHAFFPAAADDVLTGELQRRVAAVFGEGARTPPDASWHRGPGVDR